ncbi:4-hydroxy-tetrahydrodipicolinate synthase [Scopulibacillus daqui]|uniref:4-hydroxy-tetrahydrodipicolinate synthase n=1 Tax=Scopulibacillus daqui TaxID=1469162 RepID=A0ABS2PWI6_9BACL|nr:4-hydroxy-tetrahydrodipicolinate synthase [Scopulibacillus daqui]MBM7644401.1 4-hydroxy-tetrahydrodipicolinate synthase [Scopulibacillus daqui]
MADFGRLLTAMVTPFDDKGELSLERTTALVEHLIEHQTEGLVVAGTTGESPTLSKDEKLKLFEHVVKIVDGRIPVIAGTGSYNTAESVEFSRQAEALGVDGIMVVSPYYSKPNQEGLYQHFKTIAENVHVPVMIYNIPGRASVNISAETIIRLSEIDNITSVKEASGNLDQMASIIAGTSDDFILYSGDDGLTLPVLSIGGHGVVSVASHVIGKEMSHMIQSFTSGHHTESAKLHLKYLPIMRELFRAPSPVPVKTLLTEIGVNAGPVRLPMVELTEEEKASLTKIFNEL